MLKTKYQGIDFSDLIFQKYFLKMVKTKYQDIDFSDLIFENKPG